MASNDMLRSTSTLLIMCPMCNTSMPTEAFVDHNAVCVGLRAGDLWDQIVERVSPRSRARARAQARSRVQARSRALSNVSEEFAAAISRLHIVVPPRREVGRDNEDREDEGGDGGNGGGWNDEDDDDDGYDGYGDDVADHPLFRATDYEHTRRHDETLFGRYEMSGVAAASRRRNVFYSQMFDDQWNAIVDSFRNDGSDYEYNLMLAETMGKVEVGVADVSEVITDVTADEAMESDEACPICYESVACKTTACGHYFCKPCITKWLATSKKCPVCMQELSERSAFVDNHIEPMQQ